MKKLFLALTFILTIPVSATASELYTHTTAEPERSFQVAGIYWLPDYLKSNAGRTDTDKGGGDVAHGKADPCTTYGAGWKSSYDPATMTCSSKKPTSSLTCYYNCTCKNPVTVGTGEKCTSYCNGSTCIAKVCLPAVSLASGETCSQYCASNSSVCTAKGCASGSKTACNSSQVETGRVSTAYGSLCYSCRAKTCEEQGQKTCNGSCIATSACCGACGANQACQNGTCVTTLTPCQQAIADATNTVLVLTANDLDKPALTYVLGANITLSKASNFQGKTITSASLQSTACATEYPGDYTLTVTTPDSTLFNSIAGITLDANKANTVYFVGDVFISKTNIIAQNMEFSNPTSANVAIVDSPSTIYGSLRYQGVLTLGSTKNAPVNINIGTIVAQNFDTTIGIMGVELKVKMIDLQVPGNILINKGPAGYSGGLQVGRINNHPTTVQSGYPNRGYPVLMNVGPGGTFLSSSCSIFNDKFTISLDTAARFTECGITLNGKMAIIFRGSGTYQSGGRYVEYTCNNISIVGCTAYCVPTAPCCTQCIPR